MQNPGVFERFKVISVEKVDCEHMIKIEHLKSGKLYECHLSGSWHHSKVFKGDLINIKSDKFDGRIYSVNDDHGLVTINPDNLIPVGSISKSRTCMRREWLARLFKMIYLSFDESSTVGIIVRDIFQTACKERPKFFSQLREISEKCFEKENIISKCSKADSNREKLIKRVEEYLPCIMIWLEKYVLQGAEQLNDKKLSVQVGPIKDIEENIWSPSLGIKGKVIMSCEVEIHQHSTSIKKLVPFAMRTSRAFSYWHSEHTDQSKLHSIMMRERGYDDCDNGLLLYLKNKKNKFEPVMDLIRVNRYDEIRLIQKRNELAYFLSQDRDDFIGPDFIEEKKEKDCENCSQRLNCSLMARTFEKDKIQVSTDFRRKFINSQLEHLEPQEIEFFKEWIEFIRDDWKNMEKESPFWSEPSFLREAKNSGLGGLFIKESSDNQVIFMRNRSIEKSLRSQNGLLGKRVAISEDEPSDTVPTRVALFFGRIDEVTEHQIKVALESHGKQPSAGTTVYRIDLVDHEDLPFFHYWNLSTLMSKKMPWIGKDLRQLCQCIINSPKENLVDDLKLKLIDGYLPDEAEKWAINFLDKMGAYRLLPRNSISNGMIVGIVRVLSRAEKSILLTSHDFSTLHEVLLKLMNYGIDFVCFGMKSDYGLDVGAHTIEEKIEKEKRNNPTFDLKQFYGKIKIAVTPCTFVPYDPLLFGRNFDFSIILEADKISLPAILSPLFISDRFILSHDESQKSVELEESTNEHSLISLLSERSGTHLEN